MKTREYKDVEDFKKANAKYYKKLNSDLDDTFFDERIHSTFSILQPFMMFIFPKLQNVTDLTIAAAIVNDFGQKVDTLRVAKKEDKDYFSTWKNPSFSKPQDLKRFMDTLQLDYARQLFANTIDEIAYPTPAGIIKELHSAIVSIKDIPDNREAIIACMQCALDKIKTSKAIQGNHPKEAEIYQHLLEAELAWAKASLRDQNVGALIQRLSDFSRYYQECDRERKFFQELKSQTAITKTLEKIPFDYEKFTAVTSLAAAPKKLKENEIAIVEKKGSYTAYWLERGRVRSQSLPAASVMLRELPIVGKTSSYKGLINDVVLQFIKPVHFTQTYTICKIAEKCASNPKVKKDPFRQESVVKMIKTMAERFIRSVSSAMGFDNNIIKPTLAQPAESKIGVDLRQLWNEKMQGVIAELIKSDSDILSTQATRFKNQFIKEQLQALLDEKTTDPIVYFNKVEGVIDALRAQGYWEKSILTPSYQKVLLDIEKDLCSNFTFLYCVAELKKVNLAEGNPIQTRINTALDVLKDPKSNAEDRITQTCRIIGSMHEHSAWVSTTSTGLFHKLGSNQQHILNAFQRLQKDCPDYFKLHENYQDPNDSFQFKRNI